MKFCGINEILESLNESRAAFGEAVQCTRDEKQEETKLNRVTEVNGEKMILIE